MILKLVAQFGIQTAYPGRTTVGVFLCVFERIISTNSFPFGTAVILLKSLDILI